MAFSVTLKNLGAFAAASNLQLFLRKTSDNSLVNAGGDTGSDPSSIGSFTWTVAEDRPAEQMLARIYEGSAETAANIVIDSVLNIGYTEIGDGAAVLDSTRQQALADLAAMITGSGTADAKFDAMALSLAPTGSGGDATLAKQNEILDRLSEVTIGVTGYAQLDIHGVLQLKRGHTATLTFTSDTSNIVSDMSAETVKVFFGIKDAAGRSWLSLEGTKLVNTGLQSVRFTITAALAAAMINGEHFFDVVAVYGYNASTTPKYTSLEPFTSGRAKVTDLYVDI